MFPGLKPAAEWDEDYLVKEVFSRAKGSEYNWIEFKSSQLTHHESNLKAQLGKELSAFGNGDGGCIVVGVKEDKKSASIEIDGGVALSWKNGPKQWFENVLPDLTEERTTSLNIYTITRDETESHSKIQPDHAIFVIEITPHSDRPVQDLESLRFYQRVSGKCDPMRKREIFALASRQQRPDIVIDGLEVAPKGAQGGDQRREWAAYGISVVLANHGGSASSLSIDIILPGCVVYSRSDWRCATPTAGVSKGSYTVYSCEFREPLRGRQTKRFDLGYFKLKNHMFFSGGDLCRHDIIACLAYADDAPPARWKGVLSRMGAEIEADIQAMLTTNDLPKDSFWVKQKGAQEKGLIEEFRIEDFIASPK